MNETIKVIEDKYISNLHTNVQRSIDMLDNKKYESHRHKFTYQLYEDIATGHVHYEIRTVHNYFEYLVVTVVSLKNYLAVINPEFTLDVEFVIELINILDDACSNVNEHMKTI